MNATRSAVRTYVRRIEETLTRLGGRPVILSQRDWHLATRWIGWGVPVEVVLDALNARAGRGVRNLASVARDVEATWNVVASGRVAADPGPLDRGDTAGAVPERWREARAEAAVGSPLRAVLDDALALAEAGHDGADVDRRIDDAMPDVAPDNIVRTARAESEATLEPFRARMRPEAYEETLGRAVAARIRRALGLPRWSKG